MSNGKTWTCQQMQNVVQDVRPSSSAQEARHCLDHQVIAELNGCQCNGPSVQSLLNGPFKDKNPSCSLCAQGDFSYVPAFRIDSTVRIPNAGTLNCGGLFDAALTGNVLSTSQCASWTSVFSAECCSLPGANDIGYNNNSGPAPVPSPTRPPSRPPTPNPTPFPTTQPTPFPTPNPTPRPNPSPTPRPSPAPTVGPTGPCGSGKAELVMEIQTDDYPDDTSWTLASNSGPTIGSGNTYKLANAHHSNVICVNEGEQYTLAFHDSYGDGICCAWGDGWYLATLNGKEIARGASFGSKIEYDFTVPTDRRNLRQRGGV